MDESTDWWTSGRTGLEIVDGSGDILALALTIYFRAKWDGEFSESNTKPDTFHADNGDVTCDFMHQSNTNTYYWSERFSAAAKKLEGSGYMWFIRPDEA